MSGATRSMSTAMDMDMERVPFESQGFRQTLGLSSLFMPKF